MIILNRSNIPAKLKTIHSAPKKLYVLGEPRELDKRPVVSIVGSRAVSPYGKSVTTKLATELTARGVAIVSGLALGVDAIAHQSALNTGGYTVAVLPTPVNKVYPATNQQLAKRILKQGGALISEYSDDDRSEAFKSRFIERNRLVAGLADVLLITEASDKSGTMHTANFALDQGKTVMVVPGNITSPNSRGTNNLIKAGALPVTEASDIFSQLGLASTQHKTEVVAANNQEAAILDLMQQGITDSVTLLEQSNLAAAEFSQTLTMLEITGKVRPVGSDHWVIS